MINKHLFSGLLIALTGCATHVDLTPTGQYKGIQKGSLAASIDVLSGSSKPLNDDAEFHSPAAGLVAETGIQGSFAAASAFSGASIGFASMASLNTLLSPAYSYAEYPFVTVVKLTPTENENSPATYEKAFYQAFDKTVFAGMVAQDIDENEATLKNINMTVSAKKTWLVDSSFVRRVLPGIYTGNGKYVAYSFGVKELESSSPIPFSHMTTNVLTQWRNSGWISVDYKNKTFDNFTYAKDQATGMGGVRVCRFSKELFDGDKFLIPKRLIMSCNSPKYLVR